MLKISQVLMCQGLELENLKYTENHALKHFGGLHVHLNIYVLSRLHI